MTQHASALALRYMALPDIQQVVAIDKVAFDPPWSARSYAYEVSESNYSHMMVLEQRSTSAQSTDIEKNPLRRFIQSLSSPRTPDAEPPEIVGYGGLWKIVDEAHISTIATHPAFRGRGWGELLLVGMIRKSILLQAAYIVLEVRVGNTTAQNLYRKYQFTTWGVKARYYHNNGEDAYDMRCDLTQPDYLAWIETRYAEMRAKHAFLDAYTQTAHPLAR